MGKQHLSRLTVPRSWQIARKENHWTARPRPGPHKLAEALTLNHLLRNLLHLAKTAKEVKYILNQKNILVNHKARNDYKFPIGFMDIIQIPATKENYRLLYDSLGRLVLQPINEEETTFKILKIIGKTTQKKNKAQVNLNDGRNFLAAGFDGKSGDSIVYDLKTNKTREVLKLEKGATLYFTQGGFIGRIGKLIDVIRKNDLEQPKVKFTIDNETYQTLLDHCLVIGKEKPLITIAKKQ